MTNFIPTCKTASIYMFLKNIPDVIYTKALLGQTCIRVLKPRVRVRVTKNVIQVGLKCESESLSHTSLLWG